MVGRSHVVIVGQKNQGIYIPLVAMHGDSFVVGFFAIKDIVTYFIVPHGRTRSILGDKQLILGIINQIVFNGYVSCIMNENPLSFYMSHGIAAYQNSRSIVVQINPFHWCLFYFG